MNEFKLPINWHIIVNNQDEVPYYKRFFKNDKYMFSDGFAYGVVNGRITNEPNNSVQLTFEQFKTYVLNEGFKVGDYLYFMPENPESYSAKIGAIARVTNFSTNSDENNILHDCVVVNWVTKTYQSNGDYYSKDFRKATQEEINAVTKKEYTIEDLSNGKCAVINDGTLDELRLVLKTAFPNQNSVTSGNWIYYFKNKLKESGVLDLWFEPVYKETSKVFKMQSSSGTFELEVSSEGIYYKPEDAWLFIDDVAALLPSKYINKMRYVNSNDISEKSCGIEAKTKVDVGCKKDTLISEWEQVYNYYKSLV